VVLVPAAGATNFYLVCGIPARARADTLILRF